VPLYRKVDPPLSSSLLPISDDTLRWLAPATLGSRLREPHGLNIERLDNGDFKLNAGVNSNGSGRLSGKRIGLVRGSGHL
jgi:hypothetical protein